MPTANDKSNKSWLHVVFFKSSNEHINIKVETKNDLTQKPKAEYIFTATNGVTNKSTCVVNNTVNCRQVLHEIYPNPEKCTPWNQRF